MIGRLLAACCIVAIADAAVAQDFQLHGYLDARSQWNSSETRSWVDGGTGKPAFGRDDALVQPGGAALAARWQLTPSLTGVASLQWQPRTSPGVGLLDAYLRYRPVSTTRWRWSARVGAFFPPVSLENDAVGWTSPWTLTPSAINSWVGEELRTIGAELRVEHRHANGTLELGFAAFKYNDPAGELLASRGWAMGDVTSALNTRLRQPDAYSPVARTPVPVRFEPFVETDGKPGWHADARWQSTSGRKLTLLRYDNRANPETFQLQDGRRVFSWRTRFWALGGELPLGRAVLVAQLMDGSTAFEPVPGRYLDTRFHAGYLLAGWERGAWRPAIRVDMFSLRQLPDTLAAPLSEHGHALTAALSWRPSERIRVTGEVLRVDSARNQRLREGLSARQVETQVQLSLRLLF